MPRNVDSEVLDPKVAAELAELEAALAGTPSASSDLVALVADVRTDAPPPRAEFRAELDAQVARDFRPEGGPGAWLAALLAKAAPRRSMLLPAMGVATTMIVGLVVVVAAIRDPGDRMATSFSTQPVAGAVQQLDTASGEQDAASDAAAAAPGILNSESAPAPPPSVQRESSAATPEFGRKVERTTDLSLSTSPKKLQDTADGVVRVTQGVGGVVESSNVDRHRHRRLGFIHPEHSDSPAGRRDQEAQQARPRQLDEPGRQRTSRGSFVSAADKLSDARAERKALLKALGAAKTPERIATLRARLRLNRSEIAKLQRTAERPAPSRGQHDRQRHADRRRLGSRRHRRRLVVRRCGGRRLARPRGDREHRPDQRRDPRAARPARRPGSAGHPCGHAVAAANRPSTSESDAKIRASPQKGAFARARCGRNSRWKRVHQTRRHCWRRFPCSRPSPPRTSRASPMSPSRAASPPVRSSSARATRATPVTSSGTATRARSVSTPTAAR